MAFGNLMDGVARVHPGDEPEFGSETTWWMTPPVVVTLLMVVIMFLHIPLADMLPNKIFSVLLGLVIVTAAVWIDTSRTRLLGIGAVEVLMGLYLLWNLISMLTPHKYPAVDPLSSAISAPRMIMTGTLIPFAMYAVGRYTFDRAAAVRVLLWTIMALAAYSAWVSITPTTGPTELVWPRFIVDGSLPPDETWIGRAVGVFNQPVVNGLILALGVGVAMLFVSKRSAEPRWRRWLAFFIAIACGFGLYLTHTRIAWLCGAVMLVIGVLLAKGYRSGYVAALGLTTTIVAANWSVFTSSDRAAGGVGSQSEVYDRLNVIQTAIWAFHEKPLAGWGIGRFVMVNTYHHQQWSPEIPWQRGYSAASHENELGILAELGVIGLALWIAVLALLGYRLWDAYRTLPDRGLWAKPLALIAVTALAMLVCTGWTVDLRRFDFPTALVFLLVGTAIGWSDRYRQVQETTSPPSRGDSPTRMDEPRCFGFALPSP